MILDGNDSHHFQFFAEQVKEAIARYGEMDKTQLLEKQRAQVDGLSQYELDFIESLKKCGRLKEAFDCFYDHIILGKKNLLAARPFFRERATSFSTGIMASIKNRDCEGTVKYHINFHFVDLVVKKLDFSKNEEVLDIYNKILKLRQDLVLMNLPLIISRARIFYSRTPKSHLSFMDFVQIGVGGLLSAIDKYAGKYQKVWRGVVIGRCTGDLIQNFSQTVLHFFPEDRKRLYRANKYLARHSKDDINEKDFLDLVNVDSNGDKKADIDTMRNLLMAASIVSVDVRPTLNDKKEGDENVVKIQAPDETRPDCAFEYDESMQLMIKNIKRLPLVDQKILRLKGIEFDITVPEKA